MNQKNHKPWAVLGITLLIGLFLYGLQQFFPFRIDLTEENRYSIHSSTKDVLSQLEGPLYADILLTGELPGGMRRFQKNIKETLNTFNAYSNYPIHISFYDPLAIEEEKVQKEFIYYLADWGINPTNLMASENGGQSSRLIFPGVLISDGEKEVGALLLKGEKGMGPTAILNLSIENLEYELINLIQKLTQKKKKAVAMITNHGELQGDEGYGIVEALSGNYDVYKVPLQQAKKVEDLMSFDVIIIAGPKATFSQREVFLLDQYLMRGGKLLFSLDQLAVDINEAGEEGTVALPFDSGLDRLLFRYGIRINNDFVQDMNFGYYPVVAGDFGNQPQVKPMPWPFYVVANHMGDHVITKGLDQIKFEFVSSLDTVKADGVKKTPLVFSGSYSRVLSSPVQVAFQDMAEGPDIDLFNQNNLPLVYLLEGDFTSLFKNRFKPKEFEGTQAFENSQGKGAVLVIGDGDWIQSERDRSTGEPLPLGKDLFSKSTYANKNFLQNAVKYLVDPEGIMVTRGKELKIRPLDQQKIERQKSTWQLINIFVPIALVWAVGVFKVYGRRLKYSKKMRD
ncbi:gliding motility-associated ABC transporter substrate-binding protein GldG [Echinicola jeungdonensis]|uniref:Gliding motility-associated ABC transporter substrate-binding protein GldG n=1 Tax=Echinicola jeungdonensis TaxID=709343 RepID=A0ABV5J222_9BACT|nr:gliding motility-associated ABC transporter substrate-binding protein GldG [Echinicola jeungdonensis]MDN3668392.1 gliding motility-associated ABC transporter substrate-binding protein GldG [Echinicola jeungdonensis]